MADEKKTPWEEMKHLWETQYKETIKRSEEETKKHGEVLGETKQKLERMEADMQKWDGQWHETEAKQKELDAKQKALEEILTAMSRPPHGKDVEKSETPAGCSERKAFEKFMRKGVNFMGPEEIKSLSVGTDSAGGYLVSDVVMGAIKEANVLYSPIRQVAEVVSITTGDALFYPVENGAFSTQWVGETATRSETTAGTFKAERIPVHELNAKPYVTQQMLEDGSINVEEWVGRKLGEQFAKAEGVAFCTGSGVGQPQGIADTSSGVSTQVCTSSGSFTGALLIDLLYLLPAAYVANAAWVSKRVNFGKIRQLTATSSALDYLWQPGISADKGPTLLGLPYFEADAVTTIVSASAGAKVIYLGDFKAGYTIVDRVGIRMLRDPYTNDPYVTFKTYKRVGGQVTLADAIRIGIVNS